MALPIDDEKPKPQIIKQEIVHNKDKGYHFEWVFFGYKIYFWSNQDFTSSCFSVEIKSVETSDGSKHSEVGEFKYVGGLTVRGSYEFVDDDGKVHKVSY